MTYLPILFAVVFYGLLGSFIGRGATGANTATVQLLYTVTALFTTALAAVRYFPPGTSPGLSSGGWSGAGWIFAAGVCGAIGGWANAASYNIPHMSPSVVNTFVHLCPLITVAINVLCFGERLTPTVLGGLVLITFGAALMASAH